MIGAGVIQYLLVIELVLGIFFRYRIYYFTDFTKRPVPTFLVKNKKNCTCTVKYCEVPVMFQSYDTWHLPLVCPRARRSTEIQM